MAILTQEKMAEKSARLQTEGKIVVFTNGCFDLIHLGHIEILKRARNEGACLFVGVNGDESVRRLKGKGQPIQGEQERAAIVDAFQFVDDVTLFYEDTPENLINLIHPDVLVKGADYEEEDIVGAKEVISRGGRIVRVPLVEGKSTSSIISRILKHFRRENS